MVLEESYKSIELFTKFYRWLLGRMSKTRRNYLVGVRIRDAGFRGWLQRTYRLVGKSETIYMVACINN